MTDIQLINKLNFLLEGGHLKEEDIVLVIGTGDRKTDIICSVIMPKIIPKIENEKLKTGYYHIGFCNGTS